VRGLFQSPSPLGNATSGSVKLLLPPRQSRGISQRIRRTPVAGKPHYYRKLPPITGGELYTALVRGFNRE
jgi:hypothetical protein